MRASGLSSRPSEWGRSWWKVASLLGMALAAVLLAVILARSEHPGYWAVGAEILGALMVAVPDIFLGMYQAGIQQNIAFIPGAGSIRFLPLVTLGAAVAYLARRWQRLPRLVPSGMIVIQVVLWALFALGLTRSSEPERARTFLWQFTYYHTFLVVLPQVFHDDAASLRRIIHAFGVTCVLVGLSSVLAWQQVLSGRAPILNWVLFSDERFLGSGLLFLVWLVSNRSRLGVWRLPLLISCFVIALSLVINNRRGILLGVVLAAGLCVALNTRLSLRGVLILVLVMGILLLSLELGPQRFWHKAFDPESYTAPYASAQIRLRIYQDALADIGQSPLWGYGTGSGSIVGLGSGLTPYLHNIFLEVAYQLGLAGVVAFGLFLASIALAAVRTLTNSGIEERRSLGILLVSWFVVWFVPAQLSADLVGNRNLWFIAGLIGAQARSPVATWRVGQGTSDG